MIADQSVTLAMNAAQNVHSGQSESSLIRLMRKVTNGNVTLERNVLEEVGS
jgi:hypothetical protein